MLLHNGLFLLIESDEGDLICINVHQLGAVKWQFDFLVEESRCKARQAVINSASKFEFYMALR